MTNEEICRSYRMAKRKRDQIQILAELNATDADTIKDILKEGGEYVRATQTDKKNSRKSASGRKNDSKKADSGSSKTKRGSTWTTEQGRTERTEVPGKDFEEGVRIPKTILDYAFERMEFLEKLIKEYEAEYKELAEFVLKGKINGNY